MDIKKAKTLGFDFRRSRRVFFAAAKRLPWVALSFTLTRTRFTLKLNHSFPKVIHMKISNGTSSHMHLAQIRKLTISCELSNAAIKIYLDLLKP